MIISDHENTMYTVKIVESLRIARMALDEFGYSGSSADCVTLGLAIVESMTRAALLDPPDRLNNGDGVRAVLADSTWRPEMTGVL